MLTHLDTLTSATSTTIPVLCDKVSVDHGRQLRAWLGDHPRFVLHGTPLPCAWMNQVAPWFSSRRRQRLRQAHFSDRRALAEAITACTDCWNAMAHPSHWTAASFDKVPAKAEAALPAATA